jgi:phage tail-like protein
MPMGMMEDGFFVRFTSLFQDLGSTLLDGVDNIPNTVDVTVAPAPLVRWLGSWIGVDNIDSSLPDELQRRIVRESGKILAWRGTRRGLVAFLELVTGGPVEVTDSGGVFVAGEAAPRPPHVRMQVESTGWVPEDDFVAVVVDELPAQVTFELWVQDRQLWPHSVAPTAGAFP